MIFLGLSFENCLRVLLAERAGATSDQHDRIVKHLLGFSIRETSHHGAAQ
jgi:hypothetical protein